MNESYNLLLDQLEQIIGEGVQLVHGGQLISWEDTKILQLLQDAREDAAEVETESLEPGELLRNKHTGQKAVFVYENDNTLYLNPLNELLAYPKDRIWEHFQKVDADE